MRRRALCLLMSVLLVFTGGNPLVVSAQQSDPANVPLAPAEGASGLELDLQPPVIVLQEQREGVAGQDQMFTVDVSDDVEVILVALFYRRAGEVGYIDLPMQPADAANFYTATLSTAADDTRSIEYYIQAEDRAGNRSIKGFVFDPLTRTLQSDVPPVTNTAAKEGGFSRPWLWGVIGLVAVAVIAGAASSGGSSDPSPTPGGPITIDVQPVP